MAITAPELITAAVTVPKSTSWPLAVFVKLPPASVPPPMRMVPELAQAGMTFKVLPCFHIDYAGVGRAGGSDRAGVVERETAGVHQCVADRALEIKGPRIGDDALEEGVGGDGHGRGVAEPAVEGRPGHGISQHPGAAVDDHQPIGVGLAVEIECSAGEGHGFGDGRSSDQE